MKSIQEFVEIDRDHPIRISVFESLKLKYPFHYHSSEYELTLTLGSSGVRLVGDSMEEFGNTDLVIIGPGTPHCWLNNFPDGTEHIKVVVIHFNEHLFSAALLNRPELKAVRYLLDTSRRGIAFSGIVREKVKQKILKLKIDPDFSTWVSLYSIFDDLSQAPGYQYLASSLYRFEGKNEERDNFEKVHAYILDHFQDKIRIGDVAGLIGMNESAFSHYFKKRTLKSYTGFINELRLNYAANQLIHTGKNVAEIAYGSGFNNLSNFNRIFKKWKGMTPVQWRRKAGKILEPVLEDQPEIQ